MADRKTGWPERVVGWLILGLLALIGTAIYFEQFRLHPAASLADGARPLASAAPERKRASALPMSGPEGLIPLSETEVFDAESLYEKINGKAELYLQAGFQRLECRRFGLAEDRSQWLEAYLFEMTSPRSAYAVYSLQWREGAEALDFADQAYRAENLIALCRGRRYVEWVASSQDARLTSRMLNWAKQLTAEVEPEVTELPELLLFPPLNRLPGPPRLQRTDGLGFDRLTDLFSADYRIGEDVLTAFVSLRTNRAEAQELARAYGTYLLADGASEEEPPAGVPAARAWNLFGTYQVVFTRGRVLAGVTQASTPEAAARLAAQLFEHMNSLEGP